MSMRLRTSFEYQGKGLWKLRAYPDGAPDSREEELRYRGLRMQEVPPEIAHLGAVRD